MAPDLDDGRRPPLTRAQRLGLAGVCAAVVLAYLPAMGAGMWGDDLNWVFGAVRAVGDPLTVLEVQHNFFRPTEQLYFLVVLLVAGTWFPGWLAAALAVHLASTVLVWRLARELAGEAWAATLGALWWALHHLHVEPVVRPYGIADPLALAGSLAAFDLARRGRPLLATLPFALALGGKEIALVVPAVIWLWSLLAPGARPRSWWLGTAPMAALAAASASLIALGRTARTSYLEVEPLLAVSTFWENLASWVGPDLHYLRHAVLGHDGPLVPWWLGLALAAAAAAGLVRSGWPARFAAGWIVLLTAPTIFVPLQPARYQHAPLVGAALLVALAAGALGGRARHSRTLRVAGALLLAANLLWNVVGIQLEAADFRVAGELHADAAASFRAAALPAMLETPGAVTIFLRPDDMVWISALRDRWDRHPWWAPVSYKLIFRRTSGILGLSNTWAFVTWAGYGRAPAPLFVAATAAEAVAAADHDRLLVVEHLAPDAGFRRRSTMGMPPAAALFADPDACWALQPGRHSPDGSGTQYP